MGAVAQEQFGRGVWKARWRKEGCDVLIAIDSREDLVKSVVLKPGVDECRAMAYLERLLDQQDPLKPRLELVPSNAEQFQANMARLYRESLESANASRELAARIRYEMAKPRMQVTRVLWP